MIRQTLVTISTLSYNRNEKLRNSLSKIYEQSYKNIEVIAVDNAFTDGSPEVAEKEFPDGILINFDKNINIDGWNEEFEIAEREIILFDELDRIFFAGGIHADTSFVSTKLGSNYFIVKKKWD